MYGQISKLYVVEALKPVNTAVSTPYKIFFTNVASDSAVPSTGEVGDAGSTAALTRYSEGAWDPATASVQFTVIWLELFVVAEKPVA